MGFMDNRNYLMPPEGNYNNYQLNNLLIGNLDWPINPQRDLDAGELDGLPPLPQFGLMPPLPLPRIINPELKKGKRCVLCNKDNVIDVADHCTRKHKGCGKVKKMSKLLDIQAGKWQANTMGEQRCGQLCVLQNNKNLAYALCQECKEK